MDDLLTFKQLLAESSKNYARNLEFGKEDGALVMGKDAEDAALEFAKMHIQRVVRKLVKLENPDAPESDVDVVVRRTIKNFKLLDDIR